MLSAQHSRPSQRTRPISRDIAGVSEWIELWAARCRSTDHVALIADQAIVGLPSWYPFLLDDVVAESDALDADVDARTTNQRFDLGLKLSAERASQRAVHPFRRSTALEHATSKEQRASRRAPMPIGDRIRMTGPPSRSYRRNAGYSVAAGGARTVMTEDGAT